MYEINPDMKKYDNNEDLVWPVDEDYEVLTCYSHPRRIIASSTASQSM
jgi:hypothetical protein